jgi:hypothetical protein
MILLILFVDAVPHILLCFGIPLIALTIFPERRFRKISVMYGFRVVSVFLQPRLQQPSLACLHWQQLPLHTILSPFLFQCWLGLKTVSPGHGAAKQRSSWELDETSSECRVSSESHNLDQLALESMHFQASAFGTPLQWQHRSELTASHYLERETVCPVGFVACVPVGRGSAGLYERRIGRERSKRSAG